MNKLWVCEYLGKINAINRDGVEDTRLEAKDTKKSEAKDNLSEDRHSRGQGQECARGQGPSTQAQVLSKKRSSQKFFKRSQKKKKKVFTKFFQAISTKKRFQKNLSSAPQNFNNSKNGAASSQGQANFRGLVASRPMPRTGPLRPRTSNCVLEDSTSGF